MLKMGTHILGVYDVIHGGQEYIVIELSNIHLLFSFLAVDFADSLWTFAQ
jgi:hypothetical protein